jgi:hypothetical protein
VASTVADQTQTAAKDLADRGQEAKNPVQQQR